MFQSTIKIALIFQRSDDTDLLLRIVTTIFTDSNYAKSKGIHVINTPAASSASVAELVFAHLYGGVRFLFDSNRNMPLEGEANFKGLKKLSFSKVKSGKPILGKQRIRPHRLRWLQILQKQPPGRPQHGQA